MRDPASISLPEVEDILTASKIEASSESALDAIYDIACNYQSARLTSFNGQDNPHRRGSVAALEKIIKRCADIERLISELDRPTVDVLNDVCRTAFLGRSGIAAPLRMPRDDVRAVSHLCEAAEICLQRLASGGRPRRRGRADLFVDLAELYERLSGRKFSFPDKRQRHKGSDFVQAAALLVDDELKSNQISYDLAETSKALKERRKSRRQKKRV